MNLSLLLPAALAGLAALLIPLLIHLVRRSERQPLDFAALRWIRARHRPQRRVALEERPLLVLRLLLLALVALFLAEPVLEDTPGTRGRVMVVPGVDLAAARAQPVPGGFEWRWLAPGFPRLTESVPASQPVSSLLRELDARLPPDAPLVVLAPPVLAGLDGERPVLGRAVDWHVIGAVSPALVTDSSAPPRLALRHDGNRGDAARYLRACVQAWADSGGDADAPDVAPTSALPGPDIDTLVWLRPGALPDEVREWAEGGRTLLIEPGTQVEGAAADRPVAAWRAPDHAVLATAEPLGDGRLIRLQQPLRPDALPQLLDPGFPADMRALLQPRPAPAAAAAETHRPRRAAADSAGGFSPDARSLQPWLALLIAVLLLGERVLATRARRWVA